MKLVKSASVETWRQMGGLPIIAGTLAGAPLFGLLVLWILAGWETVSGEIIFASATAVAFALCIFTLFLTNLVRLPYRELRIRAEIAEAALSKHSRSALLTVKFGAMGFDLLNSYNGRIMGFFHLAVVNRGPHPCSAEVVSMELIHSRRKVSGIPFVPPQGSPIDRVKEVTGNVAYEDCLPVVLKQNIVMGQRVAGYLFVMFDKDEFASVMSASPIFKVTLQNTYDERFEEQMSADDFGPINADERILIG